MTGGLNDVKHLPEQQRAIVRRGRWMVAGALLGLLAAYGITGASDYADAVRVQALQDQHAHQLAASQRAAFAAGRAEGVRSVACVGLRLDARTGEHLK